MSRTLYTQVNEITLIRITTNMKVTWDMLNTILSIGSEDIF